MPGPVFAGKMGNLGRTIVSCSQRLIISQQKRSASSSCGRPLSSRSSEPTRRNSSLHPCLVLPPDHFARGLVEDDKKGAGKEKDNYYYCYYSLGEKKVLGVTDDYDDDNNLCSNSSRKMGVLLPWEKDILLPRDAICVGSSHGWLAYINTREDCSLYLFKHPPLSSPDFFASGMFRLPPLQTLPRIPSVVTRKTAADPDRRPASHSQHPAAVTREYYCWGSERAYSSDVDVVVGDGDNNNKDSPPMPPSRSPYFIAETLVTKLILSSAPSPSPSPPPLSSSCPVIDTAGCMALALITRDKLAFCKLGDMEWTPVKASNHYSDVIYSTKHGCFFALQSFGFGYLDRIDFTDDPFSPKTYILQPSAPLGVEETWSDYDLEYLVEMEPSGEILLIKGYLCRTYPRKLPDQVHVYKLDYVRQAWEPVKHIGHHALFVGPNNHSFSLSTLDFPHLKPNSIHIIHTSRKPRYDPKNARSFHHPKILVFDIEDGTFEPFHTFDSKFIYPLPVWVAPCSSN